MPNMTPCPLPAAWQRYLLGQLPDAAASLLDTHLEQCPTCVQALGGLAATDSLVDSVQASGRLRRPRNAVIENLVQKLDSLIRKLPQRVGQYDTLSPPAVNSETVASATAAPAPATGHSESVQLSGRPRDQPQDYLAPAQAPDEMGRLGGYRVLKVLGQGGMGVVFLAEDVRLKRRLALKVMRPSVAASAEARQRFIHEAQATAAIEHEHIVAIFQVGEERDVPFLAMPLLQGETLEERLRSATKLTIPEAVRLAREIAEGLAAAHDKGLIHRDIKPVNVWLARPLTLPGSPIGPADVPRVKILDFGLARSLEGDVHLTQTGAIVGTPAYMSPEQARGENLDGRTDLFSLGCVLYRMLTGERPFKGTTPMSLLRSLEVDEPLPPQQVNRQVPASISQLTMRLLKKNAAERPASAQAVVKWLRAIENDLPKGTTGPAYPIAVAVHPETGATVALAPPHWTWVRRYVPLAAAAVLLLLGGGILMAGVIWKLTRPNTEVAATIPPPRPSPIQKSAALSIRANRKLKENWLGKSIAESRENALPQLGPGAYVAEPLPIKDLEKWTIKTSSFLGEPPAGVVFLPDGLHLAILSGSQWFHVNMVTFEIKEAPAKGAYTALSPDGQEWVTKNGLVVVVEALAADREKRTFREAVQPVASLAYSPDGTKLATIGDDALRIYDMVTRSHLKDTEKGGTNLGWSPDGTQLLSFIVNNYPLNVIEEKTGNIQKTFVSPTVLLHAQWSPKGSPIATHGYDNKLLLWELGEDANDSPVETGLTCTSALTWSPDGEFLAYGNGNEVALWSRQEQREIRRLPGHTRAVVWAGFSPDGKTIVSCSKDQTIRFWETATGRYLGTIVLVSVNGQPCCLAVSTKGHYSGGKDVEKAFSYEYIKKKQAGDKPPEEFADTFHWNNEPKRVKLLAGD